MALGILLIMFIGMSVISILGLLLMYLIKNERAKTAVFYCMSVWGMAVAAISATSLPSNFTAEQLVAWGLGFLSVIGLIVHTKTGTKNLRLASYILVTISVIAGIAKLFLI